MTAKILIVLTSHDKLGETGNKTGYWKEEFATPYYALIDAGVKVTLASPKGGVAPLDPNSEGEDYVSKSTLRLDNDSETKKALDNTAQLRDIKASEFDAIFYPGGHGPLWDIANDLVSIKLLETFYNSGKPVATVCHASSALIHAKDHRGDPIVKGKTVTGFTNAEEAAVGLTDVVPFLLEDELEGVGAVFSNGGNFAPNVAHDGLIITGQNPQSSQLVAETLLKSIE